MSTKVKRLFHIIHFTIISPELFFALTIILCWNYELRFISEIGVKVKGDEEIWKVLSALPFAFAATIFKSSQKLRAPLDSKSNKELYEWSSYNKLTDRVMVSFGIAIFCCGMILYLFVFRQSFSAETIGTLYLISLSVSGTTALLIFIAAQSLREIVERHGN